MWSAIIGVLSCIAAIVVDVSTKDDYVEYYKVVSVEHCMYDGYQRVSCYVGIRRVGNQNIRYLRGFNPTHLGASVTRKCGKRRFKSGYSCKGYF